MYGLEIPKPIRYFFWLIGFLAMLWLCNIVEAPSFGATCTAPSRSNLAANSILTSTEYNTSLNNAYNALAAGNLDLGCAASGSLDDTATLSSSVFGAMLNGIKEGCTVTNTDTNTLSVDRCMLAVNGNFVRTTSATTVTWGCSGCSSESASTVYYLFAKTGSSGSTLNLLISTTAPNADGYDASNNRILALFVNNAGSNIESVSNAVRGNTYEKTWFSDANIGGANPDLGTVDVATYTGIEDAGLTLTQQTGSVQTFVPCSSTNASSGTTCAAGNESLGIAFFNPFTTNIEVCASFGHTFGLNASSSLGITFEVVQTPNAAQTISAEGNGRVGTAFTTSAAAGTSPGSPYHVCGLFKSVASGKVTFRLFYEQDATGTVTQSIVLADQAAAVGQRDVHFVARPVN